MTNSMITPDTAAAAFVAPSAELYGDVRLHPGSSIWPQAVLRGDALHIEVGAYSNLQDFVMIHVGAGTPSVIGRYCSITHHVTVHGATIGDHCLIGINATLMDGAVIGENSIVAGQSIVREGQIVPPNSIVAGVPAKVVGTRNNGAANKINALAYFENAQAFARGHHRRWADPDFAELQAQWARRIPAEFGDS
ncbi:MAG: gamma carbonic anhydrase family protein [Pseudomonadota bacterium]